MKTLLSVMLHRFVGAYSAALSLVFVVLAFAGSAQFANFPITLSLPYDADTITTTQPTFVWQCNLSAIQTDPRLSLQFALVEKENTQTAAEAIATNLPICVTTGLMATSYNYPSTLQELEKGKTYVWQVLLLFNDQVVQESEPWKFTIDDPKIPREQYILLRRQADGSRYTIERPVLYIMIPNDRNITSTKAVVRNSKNESFKVDLSSPPEAENQQGMEENRYYVVNMEENDLKKGDYTFEWRSGKGQIYYLNFQLK